MKTNNTRIMLNLGAPILGAVLALIAAALLSGCATIRTLPGLGAALTPAWDDATLASCWSGANAGQRNMNILSPGMSDRKFKERVAWQEKRGANTVHLFVSNKADGEYAGYSIYGASWDWSIDKAYCGTFRERIAYCRGRGLAVVLWLFADDSADWNRTAAKDFPRYLSDLKNEGLLTYASTVVVGLELDEYFNASQVAALVKATRAVYGGKVGTHQTSGRADFAGLADICFYQVAPGRSASWIEAEARKIAGAVGKPMNFFELDRRENRSLCEAALKGGAYAVGNW